MRTLVAVPCMDMVQARFMHSLLNMERVGEVSYEVEIGSLIYNARNNLLIKAMNGGYDRILWLDSDMTFSPGLLRKLSKDIDNGCEFVSGLYCERKKPFKPTIFQMCQLDVDADGHFKPTAETYMDYPKNSLSDIAACGFGCVLMTMDAVNKMAEKFGKYLFMPVGGFGEDLSFCMRAHEAGFKFWCDSSVMLGHIGHIEIKPDSFDRLKRIDDK